MGCCSYGGKGTNTFELELLDNQSKSLQKINGNFGATAEGSLVTMKFEKDVQIKPNIVYTLTLLIKGSQIEYAEGGQESVTGPDGTKFVFSNSCLSTARPRDARISAPPADQKTSTNWGQIPQIQYFSEKDEGRCLQVIVIMIH